MPASGDGPASDKIMTSAEIVEKIRTRAEGIAQLVLRNIPDELLGVRIRRLFYRYWLLGSGEKFGVSCGVVITGFRQIRIGSGALISRGAMLYAHASKGIQIGCDCSIGPGAIVSSADGGCVTIGDGTLLGPRTVTVSANHIYADPHTLIRHQGFSAKSIEIGKDVWIGANATILGGVKIGDGSVIGAGSVVTKDVPSRQVWAGVPARFVKPRSDENVGYSPTSQELF